MIIFFFCGILFCMLLWTLFYAKHWKKGVSANLSFAQDYVYAGEQAVLVEQIENRKKMPVPVMEAAFHTDKSMIFPGMENAQVSDYTYKRDVFSMLGYQRITRRLPVLCQKRGIYEISQMDCTSFSTLYQKRYTMEQPVHTSLSVYAKRVNVSNIMLTCEQMLGARQCERKLYEDPFAFQSIREYTLTDPMKTINWKASAKTGELMVNTFESTLTESVMFYLDMEDGGILKQEELIEDSVSVAATLAKKMLKAGMQVGIAVNDTYLEPAGGKNQEKKLEELLAAQKPTTNRESFGKLLSREMNASFAVVISKNAAKYKNILEDFGLGDTSGVLVVPYWNKEAPDFKYTEGLRVIGRQVEKG